MSSRGSLRRGVAATVGQLRGDGRGWLFVVVTVGWLFAIGTRVVFPALLPQVRAALALDLTTAGLVLTALWVAYAVSQFPGGVLGDRFGERAILAASAAVATGGLVLAAVAPDLRVFVAGTVVFGVGTGLYSTPRMTVLSDVYPRAAATAIGVSQAAGNVGTAALPVVAGLLAATALGWRGGIGFAALPFAAVVAGLWLTVPRRTSSAAVPDAERSFRSMLGGILRPGPLLVFAVMLAMSVVYQGFTSFYPTYLVTEKGLSNGTAALLFGLFFATGVVIQPLMGTASDRIGTRVALVGCVVTTTGALVVLTLADGLLVLVPLTVLLGVQLGFWPVVNAHAITLLPTAVQGSGFGLIRTAYLLLAATAPAGIGALADAGLFDEAFLLLAVSAGVALVFVLRLPTD
ncbi:MFS transporter [Halorarius litoreus]|uniref:MFS transporter n=1 Tax=Halorarius litoreus TaxID=2962676 RepID=UPI0020CFAD27|nr:MFS transporter [Halorarius litoreus]